MIDRNDMVIKNEHVMCDGKGCTKRAMFKIADYDKPNEWMVCVDHLEVKVKKYNDKNLMYRLYYQE